ncbi:MAG: tyrosine--tRNA ligase [Candidatus Limnocylindrales bacterium]
MPPTPAPVALLTELRWRGMIAESSDGLEARLERGPVSGYVGIDPSGPSLHVGHLVQTFLLTHLQRAGGRPVVVVGGGTGMIGDPSGTSNERNLLDKATLARNVANFRRQLGRFLDFEPGATGALMVDNAEWLERYSVLDFLREIGKHFPLSYMLAKESVQGRLAAGVSFTEFSYMTLQATDFLVLHRDRGVDLQMGGADQWGNITAGLELIRRAEGREERAEPTAFGLVSPLLLTADGQKMGKTARGAIFLDPDLTSPFDFYQYWLTQPDSQVGRPLRWLTLMARGEIEALEAEQAAHPEGRIGQRAFAHDLTARVHGAAEADRQVRVAEAAFGGGPIEDPEILAELHAHAGGFDFTPAQMRDGLLSLLVAAGLYASNGEARRAISQGGLRLNERRIAAPDEPVPALVAGHWLVARQGKRSVRVGRLVGA